jgi:hypothetical protein
LLPYLAQSPSASSGKPLKLNFTLSYEFELLALAIIFYVYDSSVLLYSNEAVFTYNGKRCWSATVGWTGFVFAGRSLCILNPFTPHRPCFRLGWEFDELPEVKDYSWSDNVCKHRGLAPWSLVGGIALFLLLPLGMFTSLGPYLVIPAMCLVYGSTLVALAKLRRGESISTLSPRQFWGFAFECIACPPFAINMVRRITLKDRIAEPAPRAAVRLLDSSQWSEFRERCVARLDERIRFAGEEASTIDALEAQKQRLSELDSHS